MGQRLRGLREEKQMSHAQLAEVLGTGRTTIINWEKDRRKPSHEMIVKICGIYNCTADYLLGIKEF